MLIVQVSEAGHSLEELHLRRVDFHSLDCLDY